MGCAESKGTSDAVIVHTKPRSGTSGKSKSKGEKGSKKEGPKYDDSKSGKKFNEVYKLGKQLGEGAFSTVQEGSHRQSGEAFAVKIVKKAALSKDDEEALKDEIECLQELRHDHIIRLYDVFEEPDYYYLVTEKMMGGELFDRILEKSYYSEKEARQTCRILFEAIKYCHDHRVAHRDLKPENMLLRSAKNDFDIKIADFGFAKKVKSPNSLTTQCGTPGYVAPEILKGENYDTKADIWSMGVIVYILIGGYPPFIADTQRELSKIIKKGKYTFAEEYWGQVSKDAKVLITGLLTVKPSKRFSADDALKSQWCVKADSKMSSANLSLDQMRKSFAKLDM